MLRGSDAEDLLGEWPVAVAERSRIGRGNHAADGCDGLRSETELGIDGQHHAAAREHSLGTNQRCSGVDRRGLTPSSCMLPRLRWLSVCSCKRTPPASGAPGEVCLRHRRCARARPQARPRRQAPRRPRWSCAGRRPRSPPVLRAQREDDGDPGAASRPGEGPRQGRSRAGAEVESRASSPFGRTSSSAAMLVMPHVCAT